MPRLHIVRRLVNQQCFAKARRIKNEEHQHVDILINGAVLPGPFPGVKGHTLINFLGGFGHQIIPGLLPTITRVLNHIRPLRRQENGRHTRNGPAVGRDGFLATAGVYGLDNGAICVGLILDIHMDFRLPGDQIEDVVLQLQQIRLDIA